MSAQDSVLRRAGLDEVTVSALPAVHELDEQHGLVPGHHLQMQYLLTGRLPEA